MNKAYELKIVYDHGDTYSVRYIEVDDSGELTFLIDVGEKQWDAVLEEEIDLCSHEEYLVNQKPGG